MWYCNCQSKTLCKQRRKTKKGISITEYYSHNPKKYHTTHVDSEDICVQCGHYAIANYVGSSQISERVTEAKLDPLSDYSRARNAEMGEAFMSTAGGFLYDK